MVHVKTLNPDEMLRCLCSHMPGFSMATVKDIVETIQNLQKIAQDLRSCAQSKPIEGMSPPVVMARADGLLGHAIYLENAAEELKAVLPEEPITVEN